MPGLSEFSSPQRPNATLHFSAKPVQTKEITCFQGIIWICVEYFAEGNERQQFFSKHKASFIIAMGTNGFQRSFFHEFYSFDCFIFSLKMTCSKEFNLSVPVLSIAACIGVICFSSCLLEQSNYNLSSLATVLLVQISTTVIGE